ncbi:MAG: FG-GAP-like repeat-containing protein [Ignavibacteria bacterium]|nr:FG-GAP-like repeat-containing protein [Ignavibacteria bacterium]
MKELNYKIIIVILAAIFLHNAEAHANWIRSGSASLKSSTISAGHVSDRHSFGTPQYQHKDSLPPGVTKSLLSGLRDENGNRLIPEEPETDFIQRRILNGESAGEAFGGCVSSAGDVNGDGINDIIVGALHYNSDTGRAYIFFGGAIWNSEPDMILKGEDSSEFGSSVSSGDFNDDGFSDVVIGAHEYNGNTGRAYIFYGGLSMDAVADVIFTGEGPGNFFGQHFSSTGDVNNDGYDDFIAGAYGHSSNKGRAYVFFGGQTMDNTPDVIMNGEYSNDYFGSSASSAGDVNDDGFDDVIIGAYRYGSDTGRAYIYYGGSLMNNVSDVTLTGEGGNFGVNVSAAGDVNGDGYSDVIVGAYRYANAGKVYLFFGGSSMNKISDLTISGGIDSAVFGMSTSSAGDLNRDGYSDIIVGAAHPTQPGKAFVYFGGASMNEFADVTYTGESNADNFGVSVAATGDFTGDGYTELLVGASEHNSQVGRAYFYEYNIIPENFALDSVKRLFGPGSFQGFGMSVSSAGDVNKDGFNDFIVGSTWNASTGKAYIFYGGTVFDTIPDVILSGEEGQSSEFGKVVSTAGDVNGDGYDDVIVGAVHYSTNTGRAYIYFGGAQMNNVADIIMSGVSSDRYFGASVSSDDFNGDGFSDVLIGEPGSSSSIGNAYIFFGGIAMDNVPDVTMTGETAGSYFGFLSSPAGDVNGDSYPDVIVSATHYDGQTGRAYIYLGGSNMSSNIYLTLFGEGGNFGSWLSAGDVTGDGFSDVIVGASQYGSSDAGRVYIYYGGNPMNNSADLTFNGTDSNARLGMTLSSLGDLNKDGYCDIILPAKGKAKIYFGGSPMDTIPDIIKSEDTPGENFAFVSAAGDINGDGHLEYLVGAPWFNGNAGKVYVYEYRTEAPIISDMVMNGETTNSYFGGAVSSAGDVNNDGYEDIIVGAPSYARAYIFLGGKLLDNTPDIILIRQVSNFGKSVSSAGDVNNDNYSDVIVGSHGASKAYVYFGGSPMDASADVVLDANEGGYFGTDVSSAGDVNGDSYSDVIVGAYRYGADVGRVYIYFGGATMNEFADLRMTGEETDDLFGSTVSSAGDVNRDGYSDVIIGAPHELPPNGSDTGKAYIYFGGANMDTIADVKMFGEQIADDFGDVSSAGDVNGDGFSDVIVTSLTYNNIYGSQDGRAHIYFGDSIMNNVADVILYGEIRSQFGRTPSAGDINGDGFSDIIVGSEQFENKRGKVYIYYGGAQMNNTVDITMTGELQGDCFGVAVSSAGDVNNDGFDDILVGAPEKNSNTGKAYLYLASAIGSPSAKFFRSKASGIWSSALTWEMSNNGGIDWIPATSTPDNTSASVSIQGFHTVTVTENISANFLTVNTNAQLTIDSSKSLFVNGESGTGITLNSGGLISGKGSIVFDSPSLMNNGDIDVSVFSFKGTTSVSGAGRFTGSAVALIDSGSNVSLQTDHQFSKIIINSLGSLNASSRTLKLSHPGEAITNHGTFITANGTIEYNGDSAQSLTTQNIDYSNITINNASGVSLSSADSLPGLLSVISGNLDLNGFTITLLDTARLFESAGNTVRGNGSVVTTRFINNPFFLNVGGLGAVLTSNKNFGITRITRTHTALEVAESFPGIRRQFLIEPQNNSALNAHFIFRYDDSELDTLQESALGLYHSTDGGQSYSSEGGYVDTINNLIALNYVHTFSLWTAGRDTSGNQDDSVLVNNLYAKGKTCKKWGASDTISAVINRPQIVSDSVKVNFLIKNMETFVIIFDTDLTIPYFPDSTSLVSLQMPSIGPPGSYSVIVQAIPDELVPLNGYDSKEYCFSLSCDAFNYTDPCSGMNGGAGFNGSVGRMAAAFRNQSMTDTFPIYAIDHSFLDSSSGDVFYKLAIYEDDGNGMPGAAMYVSPQLQTPQGTSSVVSKVHELDSPINILPNTRFYVGYIQTTSENIRASYQHEIPVRRNAFYFSHSDTSGVWHDFSDSSKNFRIDISPRTSRELQLTILLEGLYNSTTGIMTPDTVTVQVRSYNDPEVIIDSSRRCLDSAGTGNFNFIRVNNDSAYYLVILHRNHLETWSHANPFYFNNCEASYDFTDNIAKSYSSNMTQLPGTPVKFGFYAGDINKDGMVDASDYESVENDVFNFAEGYVSTDINGDGTVDASDAAIVENNAYNFVCVMNPIISP